MHYPDLPALIADRTQSLSKSPVALILAEDEVELDSTIAHHAKVGFGQIIVFCAADLVIPDLPDQTCHRVDFKVLAEDALPTIVNAVIDAAPDTWVYYCYNAEYLFYPFCENRTVGELTSFCTGERRNTVFTYVVDLYASDLGAHPNATAPDDAHFDREGHYALARKNSDWVELDRQIDVFGGLRWRFEEHMPEDRRRIDRVPLFKAAPGLRLRKDRTFSTPEYNTYACPWHHSPTAAVCSFRTAKALRRNPGSRHLIDSFMWSNSARFDWQSQQLLDLGLIEPGQWF